jgi:hypothetical protein
MEQNKYDVAKDSGVQHQQALVKKTLPSPKARKRFQIPGGKLMMDPVDGTIHTKEDMVEAVYTWLRHTRFFNEVTISFARDLTKVKTKSSKVLDFDASPDGSPIWQVHPARKHYLAEKIAEYLFANKNVVAVEVTSKALTLVFDADAKFDPKSENWGPYVEFLPNYKAKGEYAIYRS